MEYWKGRTAIVTGAGSGIGRALARALASRGAFVAVTDVNGAASEAVAAEIGAQASGSRLDVREAVAFRSLVEAFTAEKGRLDFLFNNAGIGVSGEVQDLSLEHWDRILDINVRGVIHGVHAAYPVMLRQGSGHIVNVASLAGLGPLPLLVPYATTKHAVVGLSTSLRIEAAAHGVRVSVLCPAAIETPLLDGDNPADLPRVPWRPNTRRFLARLAGPAYPVERFAEEALDAVARNKGVIVIPGRARMAWLVGRWAPGLVEKKSGEAVAAERRLSQALRG